MQAIAWMIAAWIMLLSLCAFVFFILWSLYRQFGRFQIHLSTAVVLMFVAGGFLWANIIENGPKGVYVVTKDTSQDKEQKVRVLLYGWPFQATRQYKPASNENAAGSSFTNPFAMLNVGIALGSLYLVGYICEWRIRRQSFGKKEGPPPIIRA